MIRLLAAILISFPLKHQEGNGQFILEYGKYEATYDTLSGGGGDYFWTIVQERNPYICAKSDSTVTMVNNGWYIHNGDTTKLEITGLYNLDSTHNNIQYVKQTKVNKQDFVFARLGPKTCPYYVVWKKEGRTYKKKDAFEPFIEHDLFKDDAFLSEWLKSLKK